MDGQVLLEAVLVFEAGAADVAAEGHPPEHGNEFLVVSRERGSK